MNVYLPNLRLPSTYQEVEYIRTSGTQYINTLVSTNGRDNTELETDLRYYNNVSGSSQVNGKDNRYWFFIGVNSSNVFYAGAGGIWGASGVTNDRNKHNFKIKTSETNLYIDGTAYALPSNTGMDDTTGYIGIGAASRPNDGGGFYWKCTEDIYSFKITQGGTLVRDFVPCYRKSDNVIGMYDLVNSVFYTNSGSGTFTKGADVYTNVMKNAYIGEVWTPGSNTLLYLPLDTDTADHSGNNIGTTNTGVSIQTYQGVKCGYFSNAHIQVNNFNIPSKKTFLCWAYCTGVYPSQYDGKIIDARNSSNIRLLTAGYSNNSSCYYFNINETYYWFQTGLKNQWILISTVDNGSSNTCRIMGDNVNISGTLSKTTSGTTAYINIGNDYNNGVDRYFLGGISQLILESKSWTVDEIYSYYNQTKSNYGL